MNPSPFKQVSTPAKITRRVLCVHYGDCLDIAVKSKWDGFTCGNCGSYQEEDTGTDAAYRQGQAERCGKLLKAIFIDKPKRGPGDYRPRPCRRVTRDELMKEWREQYPGTPLPAWLQPSATVRSPKTDLKRGV